MAIIRKGQPRPAELFLELPNVTYITFGSSKINSAGRGCPQRIIATNEKENISVSSANFCLHSSGEREYYSG